MDEKLFKEALLNYDLSLMKKVSKGDCHNHAGSQKSDFWEFFIGNFI